MRSISLAVDVTNYVMLELGHPIHGYDLAKLQGDIVVRTANEGEKLTTLDGVVRTLVGRGHRRLRRPRRDRPGRRDGRRGHRAFRVLDRRARRGGALEPGDDGSYGPSPQAPVRGIQALRTRRRPRPAGACDPAGRRAAGRARRRNDRRGSDRRRRGARARRRDDERRPARHASRVSTSTPRRSSRRSKATRSKSTLDHDTVTATPPSWRFDINDPYDLVEEVLRVVGYDKVPSVLPEAPAGRGLTTAQVIRRRAGMVLAGEGLIEVKTFPFAGPADWDRLGLAADDVRRTQVLLANPLSAEEPGMTTTLLTGLLQGAGAQHRPRPHRRQHRRDRPGVHPARRRQGADLRRRRTPVRRASSPRSTTRCRTSRSTSRLLMSGARETRRLVGRRSRRRRGATRSRSSSTSPRSCTSTSRSSRPSSMPWHPGRCAAFVLDGTVIGHAGEIHPRVLKAYGLPPRVVGAEIDLDALIAAAPRVGPRPDFSTFPVAKEDLALVVDADVPAATLQHALEGVERPDRVRATVRRLRGRSAARGQEVAGVRAAAACTRPYVDRRRDQVGPRRRDPSGSSGGATLVPRPDEAPCGSAGASCVRR